jgi:hypothetical protein
MEERAKQIVTQNRLKIELERENLEFQREGLLHKGRVKGA